MSLIPYASTIAQALSIAGLVLTPLCSYYFRIYSQTLDLAQMLVVFYMVYGGGQTLVSSHMQYSWIKFMPNFLSKIVDCSQPKFTYICNQGHLISPVICWLAALILMFIIIKIIQCKKPNIRYQSFYNLWKGFNRWWFAPLVYFSSKTLIKQLKKDSSVMIKDDLYASGIILGYIFVWMVVELIGYKCTQRQVDNVWRKWMEFFSHWRVVSIMVLCVVAEEINSLAKYFIYGSLIIYQILYLVKYKFTFPCCQRVFFIIQQAVIITIYSIYIFNVSLIPSKDLDLIALAIVFVLEFLLFIPKFYKYCKTDDNDEEVAVNPQQQKSSPKKQVRRQNSFQSPEMPQNSFQNLQSSNRRGRK